MGVHAGFSAIVCYDERILVKIENKTKQIIVDFPLKQLRCKIISAIRLFPDYIDQSKQNAALFQSYVTLPGSIHRYCALSLAEAQLQYFHVPLPAIRNVMSVLLFGIHRFFRPRSLDIAFLNQAQWQFPAALHPPAREKIHCHRNPRQKSFGRHRLSGKGHYTKAFDGLLSLSGIRVKSAQQQLLHIDFFSLFSSIQKASSNKAAGQTAKSCRSLCA